MKKFENIVVGLDISKASISILQRAFLLAKENNAKVTIIHAIDTNWFAELFTSSNLEELHNRTKNLILRRKKEDHLDLPPKIVAPYYVEIDDMNQYHRVFDEYLEWAKSEGKRLGTGRHMVELIVLRKYLALEKTKQTIELAEQAIENGQKVIIFTNFTHSFEEMYV